MRNLIRIIDESRIKVYPINSCTGKHKFPIEHMHVPLQDGEVTFSAHLDAMIHLEQEEYYEMLHRTETPPAISNPRYIVPKENRTQLPVDSA